MLTAVDQQQISNAVAILIALQQLRGIKQRIHAAAIRCEGGIIQRVALPQQAKRIQIQGVGYITDSRIEVAIQHSRPVARKRTRQAGCMTHTKHLCHRQCAKRRDMSQPCAIRSNRKQRCLPVAIDLQQQRRRQCGIQMELTIDICCRVGCSTVHIRHFYCSGNNGATSSSDTP